MGQSGFWHEEKWIQNFCHKKPVLTTLSESIPWEGFRSLLEQGYIHERKSNAGRRWIDPLILFKMLVLQQLFSLSDEEQEFQVSDRWSFEECIALGVMHSFPEATTVAFFRELLCKAGVIEELLERFEGRLRARGLEARGGQWRPSSSPNEEICQVASFRNIPLTVQSIKTTYRKRFH